MSIEVVSTADDGTKTVLSDEKETKVEATAETKTEVAADEAEQTTEEITEESEELAAAGEEEEAVEEVKPKKKGGFQKKLERKDREIEALRQQMAELQSKQTAPAVVSDDSDPEPDLDKFDSHADYTKALAKWTYRQEKKQESAKNTQAEMNAKVKEAVTKYEAALKDLIKSTPDAEDAFEEVAHIKPCAALSAAIVESEFSAKLAYELAKDPEEYQRINSLSPLSVAKEIGKLELKLTRQAEEKAAKLEEEKQKTTKAPAPLKSLKGNTVVTKKADINDLDLPFAEYDRLRRAEEIKHKKALRA